MGRVGTPYYIGMGNAHVKIIASLRINNGLKCQRGTSSICFSAANPNNRGTGTATATATPHRIWHLCIYHTHTYIYRHTPLALYLFVSFKNKTQTELERTEQCAGIEGAQFEIFKQIR